MKGDLSLQSKWCVRADIQAWYPELRAVLGYILSKQTLGESQASSSVVPCHQIPAPPPAVQSPRVWPHLTDFSLLYTYCDKLLCSDRSYTLFTSLLSSHKPPSLKPVRMCCTLQSLETTVFRMKSMSCKKIC